MNYQSIFYILFTFVVLRSVNVFGKSININAKNKRNTHENFTLNQSSLSISRRSIDGSSLCRPLDFTNHSLQLHYHPISIINRDAYTTFSSCYFEFEKSLIVCNELTARFIYLFYLPVNAKSDKEYGYLQSNSNIRCNLGNNGIKEWSLWYQKSDLSFEKIYYYTFSKKKEENMKYHFELIFENNCVYNLQLEKVEFTKATSFSHCYSPFNKSNKKVSYG